MAKHDEDDHESGSEGSSVYSQEDEADTPKRPRESRLGRFFSRLAPSSHRKSKAKGKKDNLDSHIEKNSLEDVVNMHVASGSKSESDNNNNDAQKPPTDEASNPTQGSGPNDNELPQPNESPLADASPKNEETGTTPDSQPTESQPEQSAAPINDPPPEATSADIPASSNANDTAETPPAPAGQTEDNGNVEAQATDNTDNTDNPSPDPAQTDESKPIPDAESTPQTVSSTDTQITPPVAEGTPQTDAGADTQTTLHPDAESAPQVDASANTQAAPVPGAESTPQTDGGTDTQATPPPDAESIPQADGTDTQTTPPDVESTPQTNASTDTQATPTPDNAPASSESQSDPDPAPAPEAAADATDSSRELAPSASESPQPEADSVAPPASENEAKPPDDDTPQDQTQDQDPPTPTSPAKPDRFRYSRWSRFQRAEECAHAPLLAGFVEEGVELNIKMPPPVSAHGRKRAVCIGINYHGSDKPLAGCANDALNIKDVLTEYLGFKSGDVAVHIDYFPFEPPTRKQIVQALKDLVDGAEPGDSLFLHYSGHGGQTKDLNGDEKDGEDEVIYPVDWRFPKKGPITDDELYRILVENLPEGCQLFALFDSCHSGSILDLPYMLGDDGKLHATTDITKRAMRHREKYGSGKVILFSGCRDDQTSADTKVDGAATGAMSHAFVEALESCGPEPTYKQLLDATRAILKDKYSQKPQLSVSRRMDMDKEKFRI